MKTCGLRPFGFESHPNVNPFSFQGLRHVFMLDMRFPMLITLLKCWAKAHDINDPCETVHQLKIQFNRFSSRNCQLKHTKLKDVENTRGVLLQVLRHVFMLDMRFPMLITLLKCWAKAHDINDPTAGTMNSFAITLLIIFHMQQMLPAIFPPLSEILAPNPEAAQVTEPSFDGTIKK